MRQYLDHSDTIYHKYDPEFKLDFTKHLESTQYSAALAVSGAWQGTNTDKIYEEHGWEIFYYRRWYRRLCHFYKLQSDQRPLYLFNEILHERIFSYNSRRSNVFESSAESTDRFTYTYFQNCVREWNQLDQSIRNCPTISGFESQLVCLVRPTKKSIFGVHDIEGVRLLTRLRVQFSDLREHRFRHMYNSYTIHIRFIYDSYTIHIQFIDNSCTIHIQFIYNSYTVPCVSVRRALRIMNIFYCTALAIQIIVTTSLTASRISLIGI